MERGDALNKLRGIVGSDLRPLAEKHLVTVITPAGKKNKGWAGQVLERCLGLPINSAQAPNFGSWELKVVSLKYNHSKTLQVKETMALTMIDPINVINTPFEESHLLLKIRKMIVAARIFVDTQETSSILHSVSEFDLSDSTLYDFIKSDYEDVRKCLNDRGFDCLSGRMGKLVQPRTKGAGHGSKSRAFYARTRLVAHMVGLQKLY